MSNAPPSRAVFGWCTISDVADELGWSVDTIRRHLVPYDDWVDGSGKIPFKKRGTMYLIPAWWLQSWLDAAAGPPN